MPADNQAPIAARQLMNRRAFLRAAGWGGLTFVGVVLGVPGSRASAHAPSPYPEWVPVSDGTPKRGGVLCRASTWDPPVLDPRMHYQ